MKKQQKQPMSDTANGDAPKDWLAEFNVLKRQLSDLSTDSNRTCTSSGGRKNAAIIEKQTSAILDRMHEMALYCIAEETASMDDLTLSALLTIEYVCPCGDTGDKLAIALARRIILMSNDCAFSKLQQPTARATSK
jgi:hypothetical protein